MRTLYAATLLGVFALVNGCRDPFPESESQAAAKGELTNLPSSFNFSTTRDVTIRIRALTNRNQPISGAPVSVYGGPDGALLFSGITNSDGLLERTHSLGFHHSQLDVRTDMPGLPNSQVVSLQANTRILSVTLGGLDNRSANGREAAPVANPFSSARIASGGLSPINPLGSWNTAGVPSYLLTPDAIDANYLKKINASLPERKHIRPEFLDVKAPTTLTLEQKSEVFVTFVHEGAGFLNALGFYTFNKKSPPKSMADIKDATIIFPNVSYTGSGGGLKSGDKVKIGTFDATTCIGFFLIADPFRDGKVGEGKYIHFSHSALNVETDPTLKRHFVLLKDPDSKRILLGVEDIRRDDKECDNDFNDAVFYVTSNPPTGIVQSDFPDMDSGKDKDGDGVDDEKDAFPDDPERAFVQYTPGKDQWGTLAYEDLWPKQGDYDFNDLVLSYNFLEICNAKGDIVDVKGKFKVRAVGAGFKHGWGLELPVPRSNVKTLTGVSKTIPFTTLAANGTESDTKNLIFFGFANTNDILPRLNDVNPFINTARPPTGYKLPPYAFNIDLTFQTPVTRAALGTAPYNPFLVLEQDRKREVHLIDLPPTEKANMALFGTQDDRSKPAEKKFYRDKNGMPWALNLPVEWDYPFERTSVNQTYLKFKDWAQSGGTSSTDWFTDKPGNRVEANIYK